MDDKSPETVGEYHQMLVGNFLVAVSISGWLSQHTRDIDSLLLGIQQINLTRKYLVPLIELSHQFMPSFRAARVQTKSASEGAVFRDVLGDWHPSFHDAALNMVRRFHEEVIEQGNAEEGNFSLRLKPRSKDHELSEWRDFFFDSSQRYECEMQSEGSIACVDAPVRIPVEYRTRIITKSQAANALDGTKVANPTEFLDGKIAAGILTPPIGKGRNWQFDIREFPESARERLR